MGKKCAWCDCHIDGTVYKYTHGDIEYYFCCDKHSQEHKQAHFGHELAAKRAAAQAASERRAMSENAAREREKTLRAIDEKNKAEHAYQEEQRKKDRTRWYPDEWVAHLEERPEDAFQCPWDKLTGVEYAKLFSVKPELAPANVDWQNRMSSADWCSLLCKQDSFAAVCQWSKLDRGQIIDVLRENCSVIDYAKDDFWNRFDINMWAASLYANPNLSGSCGEHTDIDEIVKAADSGQGVAAYVASLLTDEEDASLEYVKKSADAGCKYGELYYGEILYSDSNPECIQWFQRASRQGMYRASAYLTLIYRFGLFGQTIDTAVARKYAQFDHDEKSDVEKHFQKSDRDLRLFYVRFEDAMIAEDSLLKQGNVHPGFLGAMWFHAYKVIKRDIGVDAFITALEAAKQCGEKYMDVALGLFIDRDDDVVDEKLRAFIVDYKAKKDCRRVNPSAIAQSAGTMSKSNGSDQLSANSPHAKSANVRSVDSSTCARPSQQSVGVKTSKNASSKKRWKFVLIGLIFGWIGLHYLYAGRKFFAFLLLASLVTGMIQVNNLPVVGGGCIALWVLLWLGGTFFIKKDGKGNRM